ncbi:MAG: 3-phosphoshikimate 1-carboxyvinyltransferase [Bilophila sp.]
MVTLLAPASKSVSHRMMVGAALAQGESLLEHVLESQDIARTVAILRGAGATITRLSPGVYQICGVNGRLQGGEPLSCDVHESGTTCRLLTAVLATGHGDFRIHGAPRMHERPLGALTTVLQTLGVRFAFEGTTGYPPFVMHTEGLAGGTCTIELGESSQYLSGLLLAAPLAKAALCVALGGNNVVSWPYVGLTLQTLEAFGVPFTVEHIEQTGQTANWHPVNWRECSEARPGELRFQMQPAPYHAGHRVVEGDWSGASYFLAAGAVGQVPVRIEGLRADSLQGDRFLLNILQDMGARIEVEANAVTVYPSPLHGITVDMGQCPDLVPTVAVAAAYATGATTVQNVAHLRLKESDRIAAPLCELAKVGITAHAHADGLTVEGQGATFTAAAQLKTTRFAAHGDHRIAMSLALLELRGGRIELDDPACVSKSFPDFWERWDSIRQGVSA